MRHLVIAMGAAALLSGCGGGFQAAPGSQAGSGNAGTGVVVVTPGSSPVLVTNSISAPDGQLLWSVGTQDSTGTTYNFEMKMNFARVYGAASKLVRWAVPYTCQWIPGISKSDPSAYMPGEFPCGQILNSSTKQLLSVTVDPYFGIVDGFTVIVSGATLPILLSRQARQGQYTETTIDAHGPSYLYSSANFGDDISVRYTPNATNARLELCLNVPGTQITSTPQYVWAKASGKVLGIGVSYSSTFDITPGAASYDFGRGCFAANFGWTGNQTVPSLQLSTTTNPYLSNVYYSGLSIHINDWFLRLADTIVGFFTTSFRDRIVQQVTNKANQIANSDIETGAWFSKIGAADLVQETGTRLSSRLSNILSRAGVPASTDDLRTLLHDECRRIKMANSTSWTDRMQTLCTTMVDQVELDLEPFAVDSASQAAGCYSGFGNIHKAATSWWGTQCKFDARFSIKLPAAAQDFVAEIKTLLADHLGNDPIPADWQNALNNSGLEGYMLTLLLEELEKQGYTQIVPSDWTQGIPGVIQNIKAQILQ